MKKNYGGQDINSRTLNRSHKLTDFNRKQGTVRLFNEKPYKTRRTKTIQTICIQLLGMVYKL